MTCLVDTLFPDVGQAMMTVLERLDHEVVFPAEVTEVPRAPFSIGVDNL